MSKPSICPKCEGAMVQGFVPDFHQHSANRVGGWHEGPPKKSFWTGTKVERSEGIPIGAFRCNRCGFLELYANKEFAAT
jgi:predicted nucleic-acid-binding Zn-ribbon protein